jgi:hypothetical protein
MSDPEKTEKKAPTRLSGPLWHRHRVRWTFVSPIYASVPANPEVIAAWLQARQPSVRPPHARSIDEIQEEVIASLATLSDTEASIAQDTLLVFQYADVLGEPERAIAFRHDTIRAHMKDCGRVLSAQFIGTITKERAFSTRVINGVYPDPTAPQIVLRRQDGALVLKPDDERDHFVHTFRGNALKRVQEIAPPVVIEFDILVLGSSVTRSDLDYLFQYGGVHGYGGERSRDGGKYVHEWVTA